MSQSTICLEALVARINALPRSGGAFLLPRGRGMLQYACLRRVSASIGHCPGGASEGFNASPHMIANVAAINEPIGESRAKRH